MLSANRSGAISISLSRIDSTNIAQA
jgi:hypothetical protein